MAKSMRTAILLTRHAAAWRDATRHPFLDAVHDGSIPVPAFDAWLEQDYLFVAGLLTFQARLLARSPCFAQAAIAGGLVALEAELGWFEQQATRRGLRLDASPAGATAEYEQLLSGLDAEPYPAAVTALWALERVYLEAWQSALPGAEPYCEFVEHWTVPAFAEYVHDLQAAADQALDAGENLVGQVSGTGTGAGSAPRDPLVQVGGSRAALVIPCHPELAKDQDPVPQEVPCAVMHPILRFAQDDRRNIQDDLMEDFGHPVLAAAETAFLEVVRLERQFWDMAWGASAAGTSRPRDRHVGVSGKAAQK